MGKGKHVHVYANMACSDYFKVNSEEGARHNLQEHGDADSEEEVEEDSEEDIDIDMGVTELNKKKKARTTNE